MEKEQQSDSNNLLDEYQDTVKILNGGSSSDKKMLYRENIGPRGLLEHDHVTTITKLYTRRYFILAIFSLYSMSSAFQWIEYSIITNIITVYYDGVEDMHVAWTSMIYMATYIPLMFVATWMLDNWGLKKILVFGGCLNAAGALIKLASLSKDRFWVSFLGQTVAACAQSFILEIPPKIASLWFGPSEVSTATSIGVFGNQLGVALGFLIPPMMVPAYVGNATAEQDQAVENGLWKMFSSSACLCTFAVIMMFIVIRDEPPVPPSDARAVAADMAAQCNQQKQSSMGLYWISIKQLLKNVPYLLLLLSYGINTGVYYAIGTLLNPILIIYHKGCEAEIGQIGLTMIVAGLAGSVICGVFLDKTKKFKGTTTGIYGLSLAFMVVFTFTIQEQLLWVDFLTIGLLGFFMTGYLPIGFEFAAEITFPTSEATSSGLLNVSAQYFGILFTLCVSEIIDKFSVLVANLFMCGMLLVGFIMTVMIKADLKRQAANEQQQQQKHEPKDDNANTNNSNSVLIEPPGGAAHYSSTPHEGDEEVLRLASTSSCYSTGDNW